MRKKTLIEYKVQISIVSLVLFCLTLIPFPNTVIEAKAETNKVQLSKAEYTAVLVGDLMEANDLGSNWAPNNYLGKLNQYQNGIYEKGFNLKAGSYNYKVAMNGSWDEAYGNNGQNISLVLQEDTFVYFRLDLINGKVYDSVNNPEQFKSKAILTGELDKCLEGGQSWNPGDDNFQMDYIGGGFYKKTFKVKASGAMNYKVAFNGGWNNGEYGNDITLNIPENTSEVTVVTNYLQQFTLDSINNPEIDKVISLIGTIRGVNDWDTSITDFNMHQIDKSKFLYSGIFNAGKYEYKSVINYSWDNGSIPSGDNVSLTLDSTKNVVFIVDIKNGTIVDSVNNLSKVEESLGFAEAVEAVDSPIINGDGTVTFRVRHDSETMFLVGSMNGWSIDEALEMTKNADGIFELTLGLDAGVHEYKYTTVRGDWNKAFTDPGNKDTMNGNSVVVIKGDSSIVSPEINEDGTVTFRAEHDGETLYLVGAMNDWDNTGIPMTKNDNGVFEVTLKLQGGVYGYKFIPTSGSWDGGFIDINNPNMSGNDSVANVPGLSLVVADDIELGGSIDLKAEIWDEAGKKVEANPTWTLVEEIPGVSIEGNKLTVASDADSSKKIKLKATEGKYSIEKEISILSVMYTYKINYFRPDGDFNDWNLWLWENGKPGAGYSFNSNDKAEAGFVRAEYKFASNKVGFIVRKGDWADKDVDGDRFIEVKEGNEVEVWLVEGDKNVYYSREEVDTKPRIRSAIMDSLTEVTVSASATIEDSELETFKLVDKTNDKEIPVKATRLDSRKVLLTIQNKLFRSTEVDVRNLYEVSSKSFSGQSVVMRKILDDSKYYYDGNDLGLTYTADTSTFKVWAPTAKKVTLALYDNQGTYNSEGKVTDHTGGREVEMHRADNGVWAVDVNENLNGKYYMYKVEFADGTTNYALDPYVKTVSGNGQRGAVVDLSQTNPTGWGTIAKPQFIDTTDAIIYEMHVRDFSISESSGVENNGKFEALTEEGTTIPGTDIKTGIDHLVELGVTHVHLLPSYDYASVNEMSGEAQFNWGYDPQNYNVPEGSYSTDSSNPQARVKEFKEMVQALHKNGIRVVMDVVYNHTYNIGENSPFDPIVPGYYYRTNDIGSYTNGSGCGNEVATERPMVRKYIKDSVKYWAEEYDVDGFRFDLMGLIDIKTMTEITNEVKAEIDPSIMIYGEPWQAGGSILPSAQQTLKGTQKDKGFAVFNDNFRGAIKGDSDSSGQGFATGKSGLEKDIVTGVKGAITDFTNGANETINYVTAHDNLNLWDKIIKAAGKDKEAGFLEIRDGVLIGDDAENYGSVEEAVLNKATPYAVITENNVLDNEYVKRSILTTGIIMTSQGVPFFQAGDEFLRSKYGDHNSYKSPDAINKINWENKGEFKEVFDYYQGLIQLRKSHPAFRMSTKAAIESNLVVSQASGNIVMFQLKDFANGDAWKNIVVVYNANTTEKEVTLPLTANWNVVVNDKKAGTDVIETLSNTNKAKVAPLSVMVLYDKTIEGEEQVPTTIEVGVDTLGLEVDGYKFVRPVVRDQNGRVITDAVVQWSVSEEGIVDFDTASGKITGLKEGTTTITLTCEGASTEVKVSVGKLVPTEISIEGADSVYTTRDIELVATVRDQFGELINNAGVTWTSSNESIATVNSLGVVKAISAGKVTITAKAGDVVATKVIEVKEYVKKYIEFTYVRDDQDYEGWNIWTWQTGVQDGQQDFSKFENGVAVARFEISPDAKNVGFVLRKGTGWDEKDPYDSDRYITIDPSMIVTKVTVTSGEEKYHQVPAVNEALINNGSLLLQYRNEELYQKGMQDLIEKVEVKVTKGLLFKNVSTHEMSYNELNEYFEYELKDITEGSYKYKFIVTMKDGQVTETEEKSIEYKELSIDSDVTLSKDSINYDENTVVTVEVKGNDAKKENIREIYMDLSELGGLNKVSMNLDLLSDNKISQTIAVKDSVTTGVKNIPVVIVDKNGKEHIANVEITVNSKVGIGPLDFGFDESRIYFTVTDRFFNGNTSNDDPNGNGYDKENPFTYHGGDLKGLTEKVPYLSDLGINTIWISPIVENTDFNQQFSSNGTQYSYHGYWAKDFETLDPHFGTMEELHELIDTAHDNGIKIMVDVVLNHAGYGMKEEEANSNAINYPTNADREKFEGMFREIAGSDFVTEELSGLPDFKTEDPEVRAKIIKWQTDWIEKSKTEKGNTIDYFRVDTVKHVEDATWKQFKNELTNIDPDFKLIGEYYGADINQTGNQLDNGQMDALLDFGYKNYARDFVNGNLEEATEYFNNRADKIDNTNLLGQFLSSHDEDGFLETVNGDLGKQMVAASLQITDKGIPVVYYGEELGMTGKNGMDNNDANRYDMEWSRLEDETYSKVYDHYKKLLNIRKDHSLLFAKGNRETIAVSNAHKYSVVERNYGDTKAIIALNTSEEPQTVKVRLNSEDTAIELIDVYNNKDVASKDGVLEIEIPAMSDGGTAILIAENDSVEVVVPVAGVTLDKTEATLKVKDTVKLNAIINPSNATNQDVIWTSSDDKVVSVDELGNVTALAEGSAVITVETVDGGYKATCNIKVVASEDSGDGDNNGGNNGGDNGDNDDDDVIVKPGEDNNDNVVVKPEGDKGENDNNNGLPETGGVNSGFVIIIGIIIVAAGVMFLLKKKKSN